MKFLFLLFIFTNVALADKAKKLPKYLTIEENNYALCKEHTIRYAYVVKIAYVGLYLKDCHTNQNLLKVSDKLIRFNYLVNVKASFFIDVAEEFFFKNLEQSINSQEIQELNRFNQYYENIQPSEYYDLYHQQGQKLMLFKNNNLLGTSDNINFSYQYFIIWFGQYPAVKRLKNSFI